MHRWHEVEDLPSGYRALASTQLDALRRAWSRQKVSLRDAPVLRRFIAQQVRQWSIETGIIERLYSLDAGITLTLVEQGFDAAYVTRGSTDIPPEQLIAILKDHESAAEGLFAFVKGERVLSTSYVKELHAALCRSQDTSDAVDSLGRRVRVPLVRGAYKTLPNNPRDLETKEVVFEYCPPEHVDREMERLVEMHLAHADVAPEIEAAWLHHRFVQIHPFQDGNGRVARALATLVCLRGGGFPLVVRASEKAAYIEALRAADRADLQPLVALVTTQQMAAYQQALLLSQQAQEEAAGIEAIVVDARTRIEQASARQPLPVHRLATLLHRVAQEFSERIAARLQASMQGLERAPKSRVFSIDPSSPAPFLQRHAATLATFAEGLGHQPTAHAEMWCTELRIEFAPGVAIVTSLYHVGERALGLMAAAVTAAVQDGVGLPSREPPQLLTPHPWFFAADRSEGELALEFRAWLEPALTRGVDAWRRRL